MRPIKVMVVDDHPIFREGVVAAIEPEEDIEVVGQVGSADVAVREVELKRPDVVLMDVRMPGTNGITACRMIRDNAPDTKVIIFTSYGEKEMLFDSIMAKADGYLLKGVERAELLSGIRSVARGDSLLDPKVVSDVLTAMRGWLENEQNSRLTVLSEQERRVLGLVARDMTNKEIAGALVISVNTARNHVSRILDKLDADTRPELAAIAERYGLTREGNA